MWYEGSWCNYMCYATSKDGINWTKPDLGDGTNIILHYEHRETADAIEFPDDTSYLRPDSTTVWIDYDAPKEERYKLFMRKPGGRYPGIIGVSGDGINFSKLSYTGEIKIKFTVDGALYTFGFADEKGEFGGARAAGVVRD